MINLRTDLALEAREILRQGKENEEIEGIIFEKKEEKDGTITTVTVETDEAAKKLNKPKGRYITLESIRLKNMDSEFFKDISYMLKNELEKIIDLNKESTVLVAGLGNKDITPDALGPKVVSQIMVTRHLKQYMPEYIDDDIRTVSAISPGVLGITGMETGDIIKGVCEKVSPDLIIAIDALASKSPRRISTTIQLTDTGINPGSGVGNRREGLNYKNLGVPVVVIGVPTVVDALSIASELSDSLFDKMNVDFSKYHSKKEELLSEMKENDLNLMVTPKEVDSMITRISKVISNGINLALHKDIDLEYIESFTF